MLISNILSRILRIFYQPENYVQLSVLISHLFQNVQRDSFSSNICALYQSAPQLSLRDFCYKKWENVGILKNITRIANAVQCQITKIVMNSGSQLSVLKSVPQMSQHRKGFFGQVRSPHHAGLSLLLLSIIVTIVIEIREKS